MNEKTKLLFTFSLLALTAPSRALAGDPGIHVAAGGMALTNSTQQGGQGPSGSTVLTQGELTYHWGQQGYGTGLGLYAQYDKQGSNETDTALGPKLELHAGPFYLEGGYAPVMKRAFTDRSISTQSGSGWMVGLGTRFMISPMWFLQFTYKYRSQTIKKQDEAQLSEPITQKDGYPLFGIGFRF